MGVSNATTTRSSADESAGSASSSAVVQTQIDDEVKMIVDMGDSRRTFTENKSELISASGFFAGCFRSGMIEAQQNEVSLPEDDPDHFAHLLQCLYDSRSMSLDRSSDEKLIRTFEAYLLADTYLFCILQDKIIDEIMFYFHFCGLRPWYYGWVINNVSETSKLHILTSDGLLRSLLVEPRLYTYAIEYDWKVDGKGRAPARQIHNLDAESRSISKAARHKLEFQTLLAADKVGEEIWDRYTEATGETIYLLERQ